MPLALYAYLKSLLSCVSSLVFAYPVEFLHTDNNTGYKRFPAIQTAASCTPIS